jgi:short-subunit dehydrogenase
VALPLLSPIQRVQSSRWRGISDSLRRELQGLGVHVAVVEPGAIATKIWGKESRRGR